MRKPLLFITLLLVFTLSSLSLKAQDGFFSDARPLEKGTIAIGLQPINFVQAEAVDDDMMMMFRGAYGIAGKLSAHLKGGFFQGDIHDLYLGADVKLNLVYEPYTKFSMALFAGAYHQRENGLKFGLIVSNYYKPVSIYTGFNYQILSPGNSGLHTYTLPIGVDLQIEDAPVDLFLEANFALNENSEYLETMSFGAKIYLN